MENENNASSQKLRDPESEQDPVGALDGGASGKEKSGVRVTVRFVRCATRKLDPLSNLPGSFKALEDCLRYCGLIEDDNSDSYKPLPPEQVKVKTRKEHCTIIELTYA
jgi:hypothetical protein